MHAYILIFLEVSLILTELATFLDIQQFSVSDSFTMKRMKKREDGREM